MTPSQTLTRIIKRLRRRFLARRAVEILAIALAADLAMNALSLGSFLLFDAPLRAQFFLEALIAVLLVASAMRSREAPFALYLDRVFGLKDRLYSHIQFRTDPAVPGKLREAQAMECLRSVDTSELARRVGPRFPPSLLVTLPLFVGLSFYYMNVPYRPPSSLDRAIVDMFSSRHGDTGPLPADPAAAAGGAPDGADPSKVEAAANVTEASGTETVPDARPGVDAGDGKGLSGPKRRGESNEQAAGGPGGIQSFPVTKEVSPVAPAVLADEATGPDMDGYDPRRLLGLIPWPEADRPGLSLTQMARDIPTPSLEGYPVAYRGHIDRYFQELLAWQKP